MGILFICSPLVILLLFFLSFCAHLHRRPFADTGLSSRDKVVSIAVIFYAVANVIINAVSGTGSAKTAFYIEMATLFSIFHMFILQLSIFYHNLLLLFGFPNLYIGRLSELWATGFYKREMA